MPDLLGFIQGLGSGEQCFWAGRTILVHCSRPTASRIADAVYSGANPRIARKMLRRLKKSAAMNLPTRGTLRTKRLELAPDGNSFRQGRRPEGGRPDKRGER